VRRHTQLCVLWCAKSVLWCAYANILCVFILLYMCPHTTTCVLVCVSSGAHTQNTPFSCTHIRNFIYRGHILYALVCVSTSTSGTCGYILCVLVCVSPGAPYVIFAHTQFYTHTSHVHSRILSSRSYLSRCFIQASCYSCTQNRTCAQEALQHSSTCRKKSYDIYLNI